MWFFASPGCSPEVTSEEEGAADNTIGHYCDLLLPTFCAYAVNVCGEDGPVARCVDNQRARCCQGACSRPAKLLGDIEACKLAYAGRDAGVDDAGVAHEAAAGLPCEQVKAGLSTETCSNIVQVLSQPPVEGAR